MFRGNLLLLKLQVTKLELLTLRLETLVPNPPPISLEYYASFSQFNSFQIVQNVLSVVGDLTEPRQSRPPRRSGEKKMQLEKISLQVLHTSLSKC